MAYSSQQTSSEQQARLAFIRFIKPQRFLLSQHSASSQVAHSSATSASAATSSSVSQQASSVQARLAFIRFIKPQRCLLSQHSVSSQVHTLQLPQLQQQLLPCHSSFLCASSFGFHPLHQTTAFCCRSTPCHHRLHSSATQLQQQLLLPCHSRLPLCKHVRVSTASSSRSVFCCRSTPCQLHNKLLLQPLRYLHQ